MTTVMGWNNHTQSGQTDQSTPKQFNKSTSWHANQALLSDTTHICGEFGIEQEDSDDPFRLLH